MNIYEFMDNNFWLTIFIGTIALSGLAVVLQTIIYLCPSRKAKRKDKS